MEKAVEKAKEVDMISYRVRRESKCMEETKAITPDWRGTESQRISSEYPIRPGQKDCFFYVEYGSCGYGIECRFNHPPPQPQKISVYYKQKISDRIGQQLDCKFFKVGACKRGSTCPFNHPKEKDVLTISQSTSERASESKQGFEDISQRRDEKARVFKRPREMPENHNVEAHNQENPQKQRKIEIERMRKKARWRLDQIRPTVLFDEMSRPRELMKEFGLGNFVGI